MSDAVTVPAGPRGGVYRALSARGYYGWTILAVATLGMFASGPGQSHIFSVFLVPISEDLGLSKAEISSAYGGATLIAAFALPFMGRLVDRHGPRRMMLAVAALLGAACLALGAASGFVWLGLGFAALRFLGQGSLMLNSSNLVSRWFESRRGFAMSLMGLGFAASIGLHPPLAQALIDAFGWRGAWLALGAMTWLLLLPTVWLLVHDRPEDLGLVPDGVAPAAPAATTRTPGEAQADAAPAPSGAEIGLTLAEAARTPTFYVLIAAMMSFAMFMTILHFFGVAIMVEKGLGPDEAAWVFPVVALTMAACMPLVGRVLDRMRTRYAIALAMLVQSAALAAATQIEGFASAMVYAAIFGLTNACGMTLVGYSWPRFFGRKHLGSIQGTGQTVLVVGASAAPPIVGLWADLSGGFDAPLWGSAAYPVAAAALVLLFLRTPEPIRSRIERD
ncbi:MAG: MFS transporter [Pseudomonadota bacterium]